jgi:hypothetical protein
LAKEELGFELFLLATSNDDWRSDLEILAGGVLAILGGAGDFVDAIAFLFESNVFAINPSTDFFDFGR